jgi:hypothetical protein
MVQERGKARAQGKEEIQKEVEEEAGALVVFEELVPTIFVSPTQKQSGLPVPSSVEVCDPQAPWIRLPLQLLPFFLSGSLGLSQQSLGHQPSPGAVCFLGSSRSLSGNRSPNHRRPWSRLHQLLWIVAQGRGQEDW